MIQLAMRALRMTLLLLPVLLATRVEAQEESRPRVGLVLSGGGARGAAHVGVIQVLEEMHVPVDYVVGTSMGSIVGGLYAAGYSPEEMARILEEADWATILSDAPPRDELWFRRRQDKRRFLVDLELGWRDGGPALPPGLILGRNVEAFLERLMLPVALRPDFDDFQIPFRCVATDLADGSEVVFENGSLPEAIRASMSLPGFFAPVIRDGRILVDGGVVDNVPVHVARDLGAEVLIVVDISSPLADPDEVRSMLGVSDQVLGILMSENRKRSLDSLVEGDIGIIPELGEVTTMSFERSTEAVKIGYETASALRERLGDLSVDEDTWGEWLGGQRRPDVGPATVRQLTIAGDRTGFSERVLREHSELEEGGLLDEDSLTGTREKLAGLGIFEHIHIDVEPVPGAPNQADVVLRPVEKEWGPHYLRFGLGASSDLRGGGDFDLGIQHTWTPINSFGGEWRNEAQIGTLTRLFSEFYQPFDPKLRWFVAPSVRFEQENVPIIVDGQKAAQVNVEEIEIGVALGRNLGSWGEIRTRYGWLFDSITPDIILPGLLPARIDVQTTRLTTQLAIDTLDSLRFPRRGVVGLGSWQLAAEGPGGGDERSTGVARLGSPASFGALTIFPSVEGGTTFAGESEVGGEFFLGGFQRLSGLGPRTLTGNHYGLGVVQSYYQLSNRTTQYGLATYLGGSLEVGGIWSQRDEVNSRDMLLGGSVFMAVDSFIGPAYVAYGLTEGGEQAVYVFIGPTF